MGSHPRERPKDTSSTSNCLHVPLNKGIWNRFNAERYTSSIRLTPYTPLYAVRATWDNVFSLLTQLTATASTLGLRHPHGRLAKHPGPRRGCAATRCHHSLLPPRRSCHTTLLPALGGTWVPWSGTTQVNTQERSRGGLQPLGGADQPGLSPVLRPPLPPLPALLLAPGARATPAASPAPD